MIQVRSGHFPLNSYLHRIGKSDSKRCQACRQETHGEAPTEDISHYLYECSAYSRQRRTMVNLLGEGNSALKDIMLQEKRMKALAHYIVLTKRFASNK